MIGRASSGAALVLAASLLCVGGSRAGIQPATTSTGSFHHAVVALLAGAERRGLERDSEAFLRILERIASVREQLEALGPEGRADLALLRAVEAHVRRATLARTRDVRSSVPIRLDPTSGVGSMTGVLRAAGSGTPLANAAVDIYTCAGDFVTSVFTDASGTYTTGLTLAPSTYVAVTFNTAGYVDQVYKDLECATVGWCDPVIGTPIAVAAGAATRIDFSLRPGARIAGRVHDSSGAVPGNAWVTIYDENGNWAALASVDPVTGAYQSGTGLPPGYYFAATTNRNGLVDELYDAHECAGGACVPTSGTPIHLTGTATTSGIDFVLAPGGVIAGNVLGATAAPTGTVDVDDASGRSVASGTIGASGTFVTDTGLAPGTYTLKPDTTGPDADVCPGDSPATVTVTGTGTVTAPPLTLHAAGRIAGQVKDTLTGLALAGARVDAFGHDGLGVGSATTNAAGLYTIGKLCPGDVTGVAHGPRRAGYVPLLYDGIACVRCDRTAGRFVAVTPSATTPGVNFALTPGGRVTGSVVDAATFRAVKGASVYVYDGSRRYLGSARCDCGPNGAYVAPDEGLVTGTYDVESLVYPGFPHAYGYRRQAYDGHDVPSGTPGDPVGIATGVTTPAIGFHLVRRERNGDYDRDGKSNIAVYQPDTGSWWIRAASGTVTGGVLGGSSWLPAPADYDGDGMTDVAVYSPSASAFQARLSSSGRVVTTTGMGGSGAVPVPGDFDGDGIVDYAVYRSGNWTVRTTAGTSTTTLGDGTSVAVPADYNGDGQTDLAVYSPATFTWSILHSRTRILERVVFGAAGAVPIAFDFDGDGRADLATFTASTGTWNVRLSTTGATKTFVLTGAAPTPLALDYDGDGLADAAVYQRGSGIWRIRLSATETVVTVASVVGTPLD